jgi:hypothetical protein
MRTGLVMKQRAFPSSRGGVAARSRKAAKPPCERAHGVVRKILTTPAAPLKGCLRRYFLEGASTPPLEEGNTTHV